MKSKTAHEIRDAAAATAAAINREISYGKAYMKSKTAHEIRDAAALRRFSQIDRFYVGKPI